jgi:hypothetical protein
MGIIVLFMKRILQILFLLILFISPAMTLKVFCQGKEGMVKYTPDFRFTDGIYLNFDQVKSNNPISKARLLTSADYNDRDFFDKVFANDKIYFYDNLGVRQEIEKSSIWGFSRNGVLYIQIQSNFNRITFVGNICHFVADITTYDSRYSPYGSYDPYYGYNSFYSPYGSYYSPYTPTSVARNELKQYLIEFETGKILDYDAESVEILLMNDPELYDEFAKLSAKQKKEQLFVFIRKFNEKNPLYLPVKQ